MGLCKCPKRKVTNQFCYEHRVNVCEYCMVTNHPKLQDLTSKAKLADMTLNWYGEALCPLQCVVPSLGHVFLECIVQSYLQWLQDSDYNPTCEMCRKDLASENCIRLTCYHVYHWACLNEFARGLSSTTAPAGYKCPQCNQCLFPPSNLVSPIADVLREKLSSVNWARQGLGLPLLSHEVDKPSLSQAAKSYVHTYNKPVEAVSYSPDVYSSSSTGRRVYQSVDIEELTQPHHSHPVASNVRDHDDNKYKRRSLLEWLSRWWMSSYPRGRSLRRRYVSLALLLLGLVLLILLCSQLGHWATDGDPSLDPLSNPNIHVQNLARE